LKGRRYEHHACLENCSRQIQNGGAGIPSCWWSRSAWAKTIGRWHAPGSTIAWQLIDGDLNTVAQHVAEWADLLEFEIYPVIEDGEAATAAKKVFAK